MAKIVTRIAIEVYPLKMVYFVGETFDKTGMSVRAYYSDLTSAIIPLFTFSPTGALSINDTTITVSFGSKTDTLQITVIPRLANVNIKNADFGDNPFYNLFDQSIRFISDSVSVNRDSYELSFNLIYHSRMSLYLENYNLGFSNGFKTNYHQFIIKTGFDSDNNPVYVYIDANGYVNSFRFIDENLYYCKDSNLYLIFEQEQTYHAKIVDTDNNKLFFNSRGQLIQINSGKDENNIKTIVFNNDMISYIVDQRDEDTYIQFVYNTLRCITQVNFIYQTQLIKSLAFTYNNDFLVSVNETAPSNNASQYLYRFYYNFSGTCSSFDKLEYIEFVLSKDVYKFHYVYDSSFGDYLVYEFKKGYFNSNNQFVDKDSYTRTSYVPTSASNAATSEITIADKHSVKSIYSLDNDANIVTTFGEADVSNSYKTFYKEEGRYLNISGDQNIYINGHQLVNISSPLTITFDNDDRDYLRKYYCYAIRFYLLVNTNISKRIKASLSFGTFESNFKSIPIDIKTDLYQKLQYVEIPFIQSIRLFTPSSVTIAIKDENGYNVNAKIGDIYLTEKAFESLQFLNSQYYFHNVTSIGLYDYYYESEPTRTIDVTGENIFSTEDFLKSFVHAHNCFSNIIAHHFDDNRKILYLNNGKTTAYYRFRFVLFAGDTIIFNSANPGNDSHDSSNSWSFNTVSIDRKHFKFVRYRYDNNHFEIENVSSGLFSPYYLSGQIKQYDGFSNLLLSVTNYRNEGNLNLITNTNYEYFSNGELKKVTISDDNETIVLYEARQNEYGYIDRKTSGGNSFDIRYDKYAMDLFTKNHVMSGGICNTDYQKELIYDGYLEKVNSYSFKKSQINKSLNSVIRDYDNNELTFCLNNSAYHNFTKVLSSSNSYQYYRADGVYFNEPFEIIDSDLSTSTIYNEDTYITIVDYFDIYKRVTSEVYENEQQVTFNYLTPIEHPSVGTLNSIYDHYIDRYTYYHYENLHSYRHISYIGFEIIGLNDGYTQFNYSDHSYVTTSIYDFYKKYSFNNSRLFNFTTKYKKDAFNRLLAREKTTDNDFEHVFLKDNFTYRPNSFLSTNFSTTNGSSVTHINEIYDYDDYDRVSSIATSFRNEIGGVFHNITYTRTFIYDGFNRITQETNTLLSSANRNYYYDDKGRTTYFGNKHLIYNGKNQLESFGNVSYTYNNYGSRISKTIGTSITTYSYQRGKLLTNISINNQNISISYDYLGRRYQKDTIKETVTYHYYDDMLIMEEHVGKVYLDNNGVYQTHPSYKLIFFYHNDKSLNGFRLSYIDQTGEINLDYIYSVNAFNEIVGIMSSSQDSQLAPRLEANYIYDAWGNHKVYNCLGQEAIDEMAIGNINPIRYKGYYYDKETGLYWLSSRYYDPEIGRFISPDSVDYLDPTRINGLNLYAYCNNDPVNYCDPSGHFVITGSVILWAAIIGFAAGAVVGGAAGGISAAATGDNVGFGILFGAIGGGIMGAGAGIGTTFIAPIITGGSAIVAGHSLTAGAAWGIGMGIGFTSGVIGGGAQDFLNQMNSNEWNITKIDPMQMGWSALENGAFNTLSTVLGGFGGVDLSRSISFILGAQLNVIPSGYTLITDIFRWYYRRKSQ